MSDLEKEKLSEEVNEEIEEHGIESVTRNIACMVYKYVQGEGGREVAGKSIAGISIRRGRGDVLFYMDVDPVSGEVPPLEVPVSVNFGVLVAASIRGGVRITIQDIRGNWSCKFFNGYRTVRFIYSKFGDAESYELRFIKKFPYIFRLVGKIRNMLAPLEGWSVTLPHSPSITVTKRMKDVKPVVEIVTSRSSIHMNREEVFAVLSWFDTYAWNTIDGHSDEIGVFYPDPEKTRKIFFGVGVNQEDGKGYKAEPGLRIYSLEVKDENIMRLLCGLLDLTVFVA